MDYFLKDRDSCIAIVIFSHIQVYQGWQLNSWYKYVELIVKMIIILSLALTWLMIISISNYVHLYTQYKNVKNSKNIIFQKHSVTSLKWQFHNTKIKHRMHKHNIFNNKRS